MIQSPFEKKGSMSFLLSLSVTTACQPGRSVVAVKAFPTYVSHYEAGTW